MSALSVKIKLNTGAYIPAVGFGTVCEEEFKDKFKTALTAALVDAKYLHIDTAWYYGTEKMIGEVLSELFKAGTIRREDLFITTKVWPSMWSNPLKSLNKSLEDLQLDYVDLFLQHWPLCFPADENGQPPQPPVDENGDPVFDKDGDCFKTYQLMVDIYKNTSKAKAIGVSNYSIEYLEKLLKLTDVVPAVNQLELHPHLPQTDVVEYCKSKGIVIEAYSPLGSGGAPNLKIPLVIELAGKYGVSAAEILVNYHVQAGRVVLPRSQNIDRIKKGYKEVKLTPEELKQLDEFGIKNPKRYIDEEWGYNLGFKNWGN